MNIVMVCRLYTPHIGGVEKHVSGVSNEAIKAGHKVDVFTLKHDPKLPSDEVIGGVHVHRISERKLSFDRLGIPRSLRMTAGIWERLQIWSNMISDIWTFIQADVIQIHDVFYWYWPIRILLPWKRVFITYHGFEPSSVKTSAGKGSNLFINPKARRTRQMIQRWTNGSMAVGAWIEKWYGTKVNFITYGASNCISEKQKASIGQSSSSKKQVVSSKEKLRCVFIGRMAEDTGARVYEKVIGSMDNCHLDMFGEGSKLGTVSDGCTVFPKYDVACVSSYLAIIEAMQSMVFVIAYASNELKYDYLLSHPRAKDMAIVRSEDELRKVLKNFSRGSTAGQVENAYEWARQQTWNRVYRKYENLWQLKLA